MSDRDSAARLCSPSEFVTENICGVELTRRRLQGVPDPLGFWREMAAFEWKMLKLSELALGVMWKNLDESWGVENRE
jgi:hypothetical protein